MITYYLNRIIKKLRFTALKNSIVDQTSKIEPGTSFINSSMARHSFCGYDCVIINAEIGAFCSIASNVRIGGVAHPLHFVSTSPVFLSHKDSIKTKFANHDYLPMLKTVIGHDVWIGDGAFIKAGVSIGIGAVVGMGAVVTRDIPPYAIVAGNPARLIKNRFSDELIHSLLETKWWNMDDSRLNLVGRDIDNPRRFVETILHK